MESLAQRLARNLGGIYSAPEAAGETVAYLPLNAIEAVEVLGVFCLVESEAKRQDDGRGHVQEGTFGPVSEAVIAPKIRDRITRSNGEVWEVSGLAAHSYGYTILRLERYDGGGADAARDEDGAVMTVTPSGIWSEPVKLLAELLAACESVQTLFGVASAEAALPYITLVGMPVANYGLPCLVIGQAGGYRVKHIATGPSYRTGGVLYMGIDTEIAVENRGAEAYGDAEYEHTNTVGAIIEEMMLLANGGGYLMVNLFECPEGPERSDTQDGDYYQSIWLLHWGLAG